MGLDKSWRINTGIMDKGPLNKITDVPGVTVGHCTLANDSVQTGVTVLKPHGGNTFTDKVMAACHVINGFGKTTGLMQIEEMGCLETPIVLTNTLSVGTAWTSIAKYMLEQNLDIGETTGTVNPVVCECNDGKLNDIRGMNVKEAHVREALNACIEDFEEGAVGAGRGMCSYQLKGGIGSASRQFQLDDKIYTLGAMVLSNHGLREDLTIGGITVGKEIKCQIEREADKGSVIIILATDAPLSERQLKRLCKRAVVGLSRNGSFIGNGSGEVVIGFTTANQVPHYMEKDVMDITIVREAAMDLMFRGVAECVEESVLSSLLRSEGVEGKEGHIAESLAEHLQKMEWFL